MSIASEKLRKLFEVEKLPYVAYAYIPDEMIMESKDLGTFYFRKSIEANYDKYQENITLVFKTGQNKLRKIPLTVEIEDEKLVISYLYEKYNVKGFQKKCSEEFTVVFERPCFPEREFSNTDLLKFQKEISKPLESLLIIFEKHPSNQFSYIKQVNGREERYTLQNDSTNEAGCYFFLAQKSREEFENSCRYHFTLLANGEVEVSKFIFNKGMFWRTGRDSVSHKELLDILNNLAGIAKEETKSFVDSIKDKVAATPCLVM